MRHRYSATLRHPTLPTRNTLRQAQGNTFTGQYSYVSDDATDLGSSGFGLMFYNARWYDPSLGRMAQADTIVPGGVQGLDRYAYVNNSPLNYVDPSGHFGCRDGESDYQCRNRAQKRQIADSAVRVLFCGVDSVDCGENGVLAPYYRNGDLVIDCGQGTKLECLEAAQKQITAFLKDNKVSLVLIGHSAGADAAILTARWMVNHGQADRLNGLVLLEPSLNWTNRDGNEEDLEGRLQELIDKGVKVIAANSASYTDKPEASTLKGLSGDNYTYLGMYDYNQLGVSEYSWWFFPNTNKNPQAHMALATDLTVYNAVMSALAQ